MSKISDLPPLERPREKALRYGISALSDIEIIALILGSGYRGENVTQVANNLLNGSNGLYGLSYNTINDFKKIKGIKNNKALLLTAVFEIHNRLQLKEFELPNTSINAESLYYKYKNQLNRSYQEVLIIVIVDQRNIPLYETTLYKGNDSAVTFSFKDIYRELLTHKGKGFYLIHNHPSGEEVASKEDIYFTAGLLRETRKIKMPLLDHIIVGQYGYCSILELLKAEKIEKSAI